MVLHFPSKLTEEEEQLQSKYAKLRRKKKQLQDVSKPKQEPEHNKIKKPSEAKDAKEVAKKLLKTGAIKAIKKSLEKEKAKDEKVIHSLSQLLYCLNQRVAYRLGKLSNAEISDFSPSRRVSRVEPPISNVFDKLREG